MDEEEGLLIDQKTFTAKVGSKMEFREIMERLGRVRLVIIEYH